MEINAEIAQFNANVASTTPEEKEAFQSLVHEFEIEKNDFILQCDATKSPSAEERAARCVIHSFFSAQWWQAFQEKLQLKIYAIDSGEFQTQRKNLPEFKQYLLKQGLSHFVQVCQQDLEKTEADLILRYLK